VATQVFLLLSERFHWFAFNEEKGWTVLIALALVCVAVLVMLLWFLVSLLLRRRFQFSFRSLLVFLVVVSLSLGWLAWQMQRARRQWEVVEGIAAAGGKVRYDYQRDRFFPDTARGSLARPRPPGPPWLQRLLGDDFFCDVAEVDYRRSGGIQESVTGLQHLRDLNGLTHLSFRGTQITDLKLTHVQELADLRLLQFDNTPITDAGLKRLHGLTRLEVLFLRGSRVTDEGVRKLQQAIPDCEIIY
jgi:hypothetical protein